MVEEMYTILDQIFQEYYELFEFDSFHYGGDEVIFVHIKVELHKPLSFCEKDRIINSTKLIFLIGRLPLLGIRKGSNKTNGRGRISN